MDRERDCWVITKNKMVEEEESETSATEDEVTEMSGCQSQSTGRRVGCRNLQCWHTGPHGQQCHLRQPNRWREYVLKSERPAVMRSDCRRPADWDRAR